MRTTALPCAENQTYDILNSLSILDFCENSGAAVSIWFRIENLLTCDAILLWRQERVYVPHTPSISLHDAQICTHRLGKINLPVSQIEEGPAYLFIFIMPN